MVEPLSFLNSKGISLMSLDLSSVIYEIDEMGIPHFTLVELAPWYCNPYFVKASLLSLNKIHMHLL